MEQTFHGKLTTNSQMVNGYLRPTTILKGGVTSLSLFSTLFLLKALLDAASGQVLRKSSQVHGGWMHCHRKAKDVPRHTINAALTHTVLQEGEVQRLRGLMHFQVRYLN